MQHTLTSDLRYLSTPEKETPWHLNVNTVGFESVMEHSPYPVGGHPQGYLFHFGRGRELQEYQLVYITKGKGLFATSPEEINPIYEGSVIVLYPGEWHTYRPDSETGWECYWVGFDGTFAQNLLKDQANRIVPPLIDIGFDDEMVSLYKKILEISNSERPGYQSLLSGIVVHLLSYMLYRENNKHLDDNDMLTKIDKARLIIREKINTTIYPEEVAALLNMSYTWFRRVFKKYTGMAPAQYIMHLKIQKAKEMLSFSNKTIKEIAFDLGFESFDYFSTAFKKQTQMTPGEFRKRGTQGKM